MFAGHSPQPPEPRHLAGGRRSPAVTVEALRGADELEVAPLARLQRSRLALAVAISLAAVPVVVLDNLPATAKTNEVEVHASAAAEVSTSDPSPRHVAAPTSTTTEAPPTTLAPSTTAAPTTVAVVQAVRAPAPTTTAPPPPVTAPPAPPGGSGSDPNDPATWDRLAQCESSGQWNLNTGNGYYGGLQFSLPTWRSVGGSGYPHQASKGEQISRGKILQARSGWGQWSNCASQLGLL